MSEWVYDGSMALNDNVHLKRRLIGDPLLVTVLFFSYRVLVLVLDLNDLIPSQSPKIKNAAIKSQNQSVGLGT